MDKRILVAAMAGLAAGPMLGMGALYPVLRQERAPDIGYTPPRKWGRSRVKVSRRDPGPLQMRGWPEIPCDAPEGYFWQRASEGRRSYRLYKLPPGERHVTYDQLNDRSIIRSGWGYVKPTYAPGDVR